MTHITTDKFGVWLGAALLTTGLIVAALLAGELQVRTAGLEFTLAADPARGISIAIESAVCAPGACGDFALGWQPVNRKS